MKISTAFASVGDGEPTIKDSPVVQSKDGVPGLHIWPSGTDGPMVGMATCDWLALVDVVADHLAKRNRRVMSAVPDDE